MQCSLVFSVWLVKEERAAPVAPGGEYLSKRHQWQIGLLGMFPERMEVKMLWSRGDRKKKYQLRTLSNLIMLLTALSTQWLEVRLHH